MGDESGTNPELCKERGERIVGLMRMVMDRAGEGPFPSGYVMFGLISAYTGWCMGTESCLSDEQRNRAIPHLITGMLAGINTSWGDYYPVEEMTDSLLAMLKAMRGMVAEYDRRKERSGELFVENGGESFIPMDFGGVRGLGKIRMVKVYYRDDGMYYKLFEDGEDVKPTGPFKNENYIQDDIRDRLSKEE